MGSSDNSTSYWNHGDRREDPIHRIHSYPARFPAFITTKALKYAERRGVDVKVVADVFCGCGTTAVEAKRNGKDFWGWDINPVAALIARVKTHYYRDSALVRYFDAIRDTFRSIDPPPEDRARICDRMRYWFDERNIEDLMRLDRAIQQQTTAYSSHHRFFLCGFSNILKSTSRWLTKSIKAQIDPNKSPRGVMEAFEEQFAMMRKANRENRFPAPEPRVHIRARNFLAPTEPDRQVDLIVTSPPYVTSYDYASIHQLSAMWLRSASDYRDLRNNMLGVQYGVRPPDPDDIQSLDPIARSIYGNLLDGNRIRAHKAYSVARYFLDMDRAVAKCWRMLNDGGMAFFVIGNTQYRGVRIDNKKYLKNCMERAGFDALKVIRRDISRKIMTPYRDDRGRFTKDSTQRKVYSEEFVVIGRR